MRSALRFLFALLVGAARASAQTGETARFPAQPVSSLGQPPQWQPYISMFAVGGKQGSGAGGAAGFSRPILNPVTGLLAGAFEATLAVRSGRPLGGARLLAEAPALGFSAGADFQRVGGTAPVLTFETALRRGGLLGHGTMLRVDWVLGSRRAFDLGVNVPLLRYAGRTRPRYTTAHLPTAARSERETSAPAPIDSIGSELSTLARDAPVIRAYTGLYSPDDEQTLKSRFAGRAATFDSVTSEYQHALTRAFTLASGQSSTVGERIGARARIDAVDNVILPFDALFGQVKDGCTFGGLLSKARDSFSEWLRDSVPLEGTARLRVAAVHEQWLNILQSQCRALLRQWNDTRIVWLPLQLALAPDDYDSQDQVDSLMGRAVGHAFTDRNALRYLRTADLPLEIARSILATRRYHVLWTHDFTGRRPTGALDDIAYTMVADAYLPALTAAVARYDSTGSFPQYVILLDAFYYHGRHGALWMRILENPLGATVRLKRSEEAQAMHLRQRLAELRTAVSRSARLQREASNHGGDSWLRQVVKVHVNITLPSDFSFRSHQIMPPIPFTPDNVMRDHRKLAFYDLTEAEPYDGALLLTGIGIGEHYSSTSWEDRGYEIRGPAALEARAAVRRLLETNGISPEEFPAPLRETRSTAAADGALNDPGAARAYVGHALQVHNEVGFGAKRASVARALLYTLAPSGSVIVVPDPLWVSETWAAMLAAAAARGCHVVIIAPAQANAPSPEAPLLTLERQMLQRLLLIRDHLGDQIAAAHGSLRIGLYAAHSSVSDVAGRFAEVRAGLARSPWIRDLIPFDSQTLNELNQTLVQTEETERAATTIARDETPRAPQLHQKTILVARGSAIAALVRQPGWVDVLARTMRGQARRTIRLADAIGGPAAAVDTTAGQALDTLFQRYEQSLTPAERKRSSFYFAAGTQNHDPRGLALDGEATVVISGLQASAGLVDLFYLMARTTWIDSRADIDRLLPAPRGLLARIARVIRMVM